MAKRKPLAEIVAEIEDLTTAGWEFMDALDRKVREYDLSRIQIHCVVDEYDARND